MYAAKYSKKGIRKTNKLHWAKIQLRPSLLLFAQLNHSILEKIEQIRDVSKTNILEIAYRARH